MTSADEVRDHRRAGTAQAMQRRPPWWRKFSLHFLLTEWDQVVDAWQLDSWEAYRDVNGSAARPACLRSPSGHCYGPCSRRRRRAGAAGKLLTHAGLFTRLAQTLSRSKRTPFEFTWSWTRPRTSAWRTCAFWRRWGSIGPARQHPVFRGGLGAAHLSAAVLVEVAGRGHSRSVAHAAHQLPHVAPDPPAGRPLLGPAWPMWMATQKRAAIRCRCSTGRHPRFVSSKRQSDEETLPCGRVAGRADGKAQELPQEFGVFVRSEAQLERAQAAVAKAGVPFKVLDEHVETARGHVSIAPCIWPRVWSSGPWW